MKYCSDCRHAIGGIPMMPERKCRVSRYMDGTLYVALEARYNDRLCGPNAALFEQKPLKRSWLSRFRTSIKPTGDA